MPIRSAALALCLVLSGAGAARAALTPEAEDSLRAGLRDLYDLEYAQSRADFRKLIKAEPDNPFGYLFEAGAIWWQASQEYGLFQDTPALQGLFEQDVAAAVSKAETWADSKDKAIKTDGNFALGMALGTAGQWSVLRGHWFKAYLDGKRAIKHLKKTVKLDPDYTDAQLGLGVFDYQAAHFSGALKLGAMLGGLHGDEKRGLGEIELAAEKSRYSRPQSAEFLASIYIIDRRDYPRALAYVQQLLDTYPESPYFRFLGVALRQRLGDWDGSLADARALFSAVKTDPASFDRKLLTLICGMRGPDCLARPDVAGAALWLDHAIEAAPPPSIHPRGAAAKAAAAEEAQFLTLLHLFRGYARDLLGQRLDALADYAWVLDHPDWGEAHARADALSQAPLSKGDFLSRLRALSQQ